MRTNTKVKTRTRTQAKSWASEADRLGLVTVALVSILSGTWGLVCLVSLIQSEGLLGAFSGFYHAVIG